MIVTEVMTFYRFAPLTDLDGLRSRIEAEALAHGLKGTILLAEEGINGTVSGTKAACAALAGFLSDCDGFADMPFKYSGAEAGNPVFYRLKVKVKAEIVAVSESSATPTFHPFALIFMDSPSAMPRLSAGRVPRQGSYCCRRPR